MSAVLSLTDIPGELSVAIDPDPDLFTKCEIVHNAPDPLTDG